MKRALRWLSVNGAVGGVAWIAIITRVEWACNLFTFLTFLISVIMLGVFDGKVREEIRVKGRSVPAFASGLFDGSIVIGCAVNGWFFLAVAWVWLWLSEESLHKKSTKEAA